MFYVRKSDSQQYSIDEFLNFLKFFVEIVGMLLLELGASIDATDDLGQKPIHVAAQNNFSDVVKLFLQQHPSLVNATSKDG